MGLDLTNFRFNWNNIANGEKLILGQNKVNLVGELKNFNEHLMYKYLIEQRYSDMQELPSILCGQLWYQNSTGYWSGLILDLKNYCIQYDLDLFKPLFEMRLEYARITNKSFYSNDYLLLGKDNRFYINPKYCLSTPHPYLMDPNSVKEIFLDLSKEYDRLTTFLKENTKDPDLDPDDVFRAGGSHDFFTIFKQAAEIGDCLCLSD